MHFVFWTVKMASFSSIKELCSKLSGSINKSQDSSLRTSVTSFLHEVIFDSSALIAPWNTFMDILILWSIYFQLFYKLSPELLKALRTIKIGQVCYYCGSPLISFSLLHIPQLLQLLILPPPPTSKMTVITAFIINSISVPAATPMPFPESFCFYFPSFYVLFFRFASHSNYFCRK